MAKRLTSTRDNTRCGLSGGQTERQTESVDAARRMTHSNPYITIAGQTASGKCLKCKVPKVKKNENE